MQVARTYTSLLSKLLVVQRLNFNIRYGALFRSGQLHKSPLLSTQGRLAWRIRFFTTALLYLMILFHFSEGGGEIFNAQQPS